MAAQGPVMGPKEPWPGPELDTIQPRRCGCVPQLSLVYEERRRGGGGPGEEGWEEPGQEPAEPAPGGWARRIPLLGPFWCVRGSATTTIRRRDNAVYRSNSFKFERSAPEEVVKPATALTPAKQGVAARRPGGGRRVEAGQGDQPRPPARRQRNRELMVNLNYSDPQDAEADEEAEAAGQGRLNRAYEGEELVEPVEGVVPGQEAAPGYRLKFGQEIYYCKPYRPFHTQLRYNFSDLLESGVDSEYEEMAGGGGRRGPPLPGGPPCSQCVTVINVRSSPGHTLQPGPGHTLQQQQHALQQHRLGLQRPGGDYNEPPYENLAFHKVTIAVPDAAEGPHPHPHHPGPGEKPRVLLRKPPLQKSKVPLRYQGIKRVKSKSKTAAAGAGREGGYTQTEVWNWLYLEEEGQEQEGAGEAGQPAPGVSVQFSPAEFLQATSRLAHLNLEGFERFVGSTIDRALAGARGAKSSDPLEPRGEEAGEGEALYLQHQPGDTGDLYVGQEGGEVRRPGCGDCKSKVNRPVCESCLRSGESSCSSALSSLESVKSSQGSGGGAARSRESDSSARGSYLSTDSVAAGEERTSGPARPEYMRMAPASGSSYVRLASGGQRIYRGRVRASLPLGTAHKPYQTLEVSQQQEKTMSHTVAGVQGPGVRLVDPAIQLHQQEWYHGNVSRIEAESALRLHGPGSYLIRNCESARKDYSLSLKSSHGYMHMRIQLTPSGHYILGQFSRPFASIADMVNYYTVNRLPIKGAEHVSLKAPLCEQLL